MNSFSLAGHFFMTSEMTPAKAAPNRSSLANIRHPIVAKVTTMVDSVN